MHGWAEAGEQEPHCNSQTPSIRPSCFSITSKTQISDPIVCLLMLSVFGLKQILQCYKLLSATLWKTRPSMIGAQSVRNLQVHSRNSFSFQTFAGYCIVSLRALAVQSHKASLVLYSPGINRWNTWFIKVLLIRTDVRDKQVSSNWNVA